MTDDELTEKIIACAFTVHNKLGPAPKARHVIASGNARGNNRKTIRAL